MAGRLLTHRLTAALLGSALSLTAMPVLAADNLVFVSGAFRRSIAVADLDHLARTGQANGLLSDVLRFGNQKPEEAAKLLNQSVNLPITLVSRLMATRIGEAILERVSQIVYPPKTTKAGIPALRSAVVLALAEGQGSITPVSFLQSYPTRELEVSIPALLNLINKTRSISELVQFFSESPLDGLRGNAEAQKPEP